MERELNLGRRSISRDRRKKRLIPEHGHDDRRVDPTDRRRGPWDRRILMVDRRQRNEEAWMGDRDRRKGLRERRNTLFGPLPLRK